MMPARRWVVPQETPHGAPSLGHCMRRSDGARLACRRLSSSAWALEGVYAFLHEDGQFVCRLEPGGPFTPLTAREMTDLRQRTRNLAEAR